MTEKRLLPWKKLAETIVFERKPWLTLALEKVELPDGRIVADYLSLRLPEFCVIVARTPDGRIISERNYKHGIGAVSLDLPAGMIEQGEDPLLAARRELLEETGYEAPEWRPLGVFTLHGNYGCGRAHFFLAEGATLTATPDSGDLEEIEISLLGLDAWLDSIRRGEVKLVSSVTAICMVAALEKEQRATGNGQ